MKTSTTASHKHCANRIRYRRRKQATLLIRRPLALLPLITAAVMPVCATGLVTAAAAASPIPSSAVTAESSIAQRNLTTVRQYLKASWDGLGSEPVRNIIALSNLLIVFWIFRQSNAYRKRERQEDLVERHAKLKLEIGNFWIQKLIVEPMITWVHEFFNSYETQIESPPTLPVDPGEKVNAVRTAVVKFREDVRTLRRRIEEPLILVSDHFECLTPVINNLQDFVMNEFQKPLGIIEVEVDGEKAIDTYRRLRREFFSLMYQAQREFTEI